jgi:hypothetical protein
MKKIDGTPKTIRELFTGVIRMKLRLVFFEGGLYETIV